MNVSPVFRCLKRCAADSTAMILTQPADLSGFYWYTPNLHHKSQRLTENGVISFVSPFLTHWRQSYSVRSTTGFTFKGRRDEGVNQCVREMRVKSWWCHGLTTLAYSLPNTFPLVHHHSEWFIHHSLSYPLFLWITKGYFLYIVIIDIFIVYQIFSRQISLVRIRC